MKERKDESIDTTLVRLSNFDALRRRRKAGGKQTGAKGVLFIQGTGTLQTFDARGNMSGMWPG